MRRLTVFISSPKGFHKIDRYRRTLALWDEAAKRSNIEGLYDHVKIVRTQPTSFESHQDLLARTYATKILPHIRGSHYLLSECDFVPLPSLFDNLYGLLNEHPFVSPTSYSRSWDPGDDVYNSPGRFVRHQSDAGIRSTSPWLMGFNFTDTERPAPPLNWLQNASNPPDTACGALASCIESSTVDISEDYEIPFVDAWTPERPCFCLSYAGFGSHMFHTRDCQADPDFELCGLKLKVKDHFAACDHILAQAEEAFNGQVLTRQGSPI